MAGAVLVAKCGLAAVGECKHTLDCCSLSVAAMAERRAPEHGML